MSPYFERSAFNLTQVLIFGKHHHFLSSDRKSPDLQLRPHFQQQLPILLIRSSASPEHHSSSCDSCAIIFSGSLPPASPSSNSCYRPMADFGSITSSPNAPMINLQRGLNCSTLQPDSSKRWSPLTWPILLHSPNAPFNPCILWKGELGTGHRVPRIEHLWNSQANTQL